MKLRRLACFALVGLLFVLPLSANAENANDLLSANNPSNIQDTDTHAEVYQLVNSDSGILQNVEVNAFRDLQTESGDKEVQPNPYIDENGVVTPPEGALSGASKSSVNDASASLAAASYTAMQIKKSHYGYVSYPGEWVEYQFIPKASGTYRFQTTGSTDTYGMLCTMNWYGDVIVKEDDDSGTGTNFAIDYYLQANTSYKLYVRLYSSSVSGQSFNVNVTAISLDRRNVSVKVWVENSFNALMGSSGTTYGSNILGNARTSFDETFAINMVGATTGTTNASKQHYQYRCTQSGYSCSTACSSHHSNAQRLLDYTNGLGGGSLYTLLYAGPTCLNNSGHTGVSGYAWINGKASIVEGTGYDWGTIRRMQHEFTHCYGGQHNGENGHYCSSSCINNSGWDNAYYHVSNIWCDNCYRVVYNARNNH